MIKIKNNPKKTQKRVLVVVPTYNEVDNVRLLVPAIQKVFQVQQKYELDILFVDDSSPDGTADVVRELQAKDRRIHLASGAKAGLGKAYIRGLLYGQQLNDYFAIVTMDADLSHDPKDIPALLKAVEDGADYAVGSRYVTGGRNEDADSVFRRFRSLLANGVAKQFVGLQIDVKDLTSGFKAIRGTALKTIPLQRITASGEVFMISLLYEFAKRGYIFAEVPITFRTRLHGTSKLGLRDISEFIRQTYSLNPYSKFRRMVRFGTVGALGVVVNLSVLIVLVQVFQVSVMPAYIAALETSIIGNFFLNHWFTFRDAQAASPTRLTAWTALLGKLIRYNVVAVSGATLAWLVFSLFYRELGISYVPADMLGIAASTCWNYWLSVRLVWRIVDAPTVEVVPPQIQHDLQEA